jgi:hypothetical protein
MRLMIDKRSGYSIKVCQLSVTCLSCAAAVAQLQCTLRLPVLEASIDAVHDLIKPMYAFTKGTPQDSSHQSRREGRSPARATPWT